MKVKNPSLMEWSLSSRYNFTTNTGIPRATYTIDKEVLTVDSLTDVEVLVRRGGQLVRSWEEPLHVLLDVPLPPLSPPLPGRQEGRASLVVRTPGGQHVWHCVLHLLLTPQDVVAVLVPPQAQVEHSQLQTINVSAGSSYDCQKVFK